MMQTLRRRTQQIHAFFDEKSKSYLVLRWGMALIDPAKLYELYQEHPNFFRFWYPLFAIGSMSQFFIYSRERLGLYYAAALHGESASVPVSAFGMASKEVAFVGTSIFLAMALVGAVIQYAAVPITKWLWRSRNPEISTWPFALRVAGGLNAGLLAIASLMPVVWTIPLIGIEHVWILVGVNAVVLAILMTMLGTLSKDRIAAFYEARCADPVVRRGLMFVETALGAIAIFGPMALFLGSSLAPQAAHHWFFLT